MALGRGDLVDGRYRILERISDGPCAQVYLAEEPGADGRRVALKVFRHADVAALRERADLLQSLEHPNLVRLLGHGTLPGQGAPYLATEWVDGADLLEAGRLLPMSRLRGLLVQLCHGLSFLHEKGLVHGSLKPSNLRVTREADGDEDSWTLKILDCGPSPPAESEDLASLNYTAPEILRQDETDGRADLYAVGVLLYQMLTGTLPFDSSDAAALLRGHLEETPRRIDTERRRVPTDLAEIAARCLMKDPGDRFSSASDLAEALTHDVEPEVATTSVSDVKLPSLVGRGDEVKELLAFLERRQDGPGLALILGEGGIGKSRLMAELMNLARERHLPVLQGACHETGGAPFGAFIEVLEWAASTAETEGLTCTPTDEDTTVDLVTRFGPEVVKVTPRAFRREVLPSPELQPRYERVRLIDAVGTFLLEVSKAKPFVLTVEDLHWADDASADLVEYLLRNRARGRLAFAAAARPFENRAKWLKESLENEGGPGSVLRLVLERLDLDAVADLARSALRLPNPPHDLATHLLRETAGNPFFVVEMLRDLVEDGGLRRQDGTWCWNDAALRRRPRPASMAQALERRLARVSDGELQLLQALALLDRAVDRELLERVAAAAPRPGAASADDMDWGQQLERLLDRGLVVRLQEESGERFSVAHDATRELVERGMSWEIRQTLHTAAGTILEEIHGEGAEEAIERIAYHFIQAADDERSAKYCVQAAKKARRLYANEEASYFFLQALKYYPDPADPVRWDALGSLGEVYVLQGKMAQARTRYEEMKKLAEAAGDAAHLVTANLGLADVARYLSDYHQQMQFARIAFSLARKSSDKTGQADAIQVLGLAQYHLGRFHKAIQCYSVALDLLKNTGDNRITASVLNRMGLAFMSRGEMDRAGDLYSAALGVAQGDDLKIRAMLHSNLGCIAENKGQYGEALERYTEAESIADSTGDKYSSTLAVLNQASVLVRLNAPQAAERRTRDGLRMAIELGEKFFRCYLTVYRAQIHRMRGEFDDAASYLDEAARNAARIGHLEVALLADLERAWLLHDRGELGDSAELAKQVLDKAIESHVTEVASCSAVCAAYSHVGLGNMDEGSEFLQHAWKILSKTTYPEVAWRAHLVAGRIHEAQDHREDAARHYRAGAALLDQMAAGIEDDTLRDAYLREPLRLELRVKAAQALQRPQKEQPLEMVPTEDPSTTTSIGILEELSRSLALASTATQAATLVLEAAVPLMGAERGVVLLRDSDGTDLLAGTLAAAGSSLPPDSSWSTSVLEKAWQGTSCSSHVTTRDTESDLLDSVRRLGIRSAAAVPVPGREDIQGVVYLDAGRTHLFPPADLKLLEAMAGQLALALASISFGNLPSASSPRVRRDVFGEMIARDPRMLETFERLRRFAPSELPVLIEGESGTGKELAARGLHAASARKGKPFVALDCGAIPEELAEVELFGCRRGAFSGASESRSGLVAAADGGTLFLDEIGNMPLAIQAKLLRVLQTSEVRRLGESATRQVNFRLIAATNEDLEAQIAAGRFRRDLYYRVAGLSVRLPPLRERPDDLPELAAHILEKCAAGGKIKSLSRGAMGLLRRHDWLGNVRELHNVLEASQLLCDGDTITSGELATHLHSRTGTHGNPPDDHADDLQRLRVALSETNGDKTAAARILGWSRMRVYRAIRRTGLSMSFGRQ